MSDASTFSSPASPTTGLQRFAFERSQVARGTKRTRLRLIRRSTAAAMQKGHPTMSTLQDMTKALRESVGEIAAAAPEGRDELLTKTFTEFEAAFEPELEKAIGSATEEVLTKHAEEAGFDLDTPLFKGLGTVRRVANMVSMVASAVERIRSGKDYSSSDQVDMPSDEVMALLEHALAAAELALRAAVNEHVDPLGEDDEMDDEGMSYVALPNAEAPDDTDAAVIVKTVLPLELAKHAADPALITMEAVSLGSQLMLLAGVTEEQLGKMFEGEGGLAKDAGGADPTDPNAAPPADDGSADGGSDLGSQLEVAGRIAVALLMQIDHIAQSQGLDAGGADDQVATDGTDPNADAPPDDAAAAAADPSKNVAAAAAPDDEAKKKLIAKAAEVDELRKMVTDLTAKAAEPSEEVLALRKTVADLESNVKKLASAPAPAKASLGSATLTKQADSGGPDPMEEALTKLAAELNGCRTSNEREKVLLKAAIKLPGVDLSALRKVD